MTAIINSRPQGKYIIMAVGTPIPDVWCLIKHMYVQTALGVIHSDLQPYLSLLPFFPSISTFTTFLFFSSISHFWFVPLMTLSTVRPWSNPPYFLFR